MYSVTSAFDWTVKEQQQTDIIIPLLSPVRIILISIFDLYATLLIGLDYHPALSQCERSYKAGQRLAGKKFARPPPSKQIVLKGESLLPSNCLLCAGERGQAGKAIPTGGIQ